MKKRSKIILSIIGVILISAIVFIYASYRYMYPNGARHICAKQIALALSMYSNDNNGFYPAGEDTPEASFSLIYEDYLHVPSILGGKTIPTEVATAVLEKGELLGPENCSWHYVEGLTEADDLNIAIFWDKEPGFGHNCERMSGGRREVVFLSSMSKYIPESEWQAFLKEQKNLLAKRSKRTIKGEPLLTAKVQLPDGKIVDSYNGKYTIHEGSGSSSSSFLDPSQLIWYRANGNNGRVSYSLELPGMISDPVTIEFKNDIAIPSSFIFKMKKK
jgi:hypothetical protein